MYFSQISEETRTHLLSHLPVLLANEQSLHGDGIRLVQPKAVDISSLIGGVMAVATETLPQYAVDCMGKEKSQTEAYGLYTYNYSGQIAYLVGGSDANNCQEISRRHAAALEQFCKSHEFFHQYEGSGFSIIGFECIEVELQGPMELVTEKRGNIWVAGGSLTVIWNVSESGYFDHGA